MQNKIIEILKKTLQSETLSAGATQSNTPTWDSLKHLNVIIELEIEFDVEFSPEEIARMKSVSVIEEVLKSKYV